MIHTNEPVILKGQHVIAIEDTDSRPKMSLMVRIPKGALMKVVDVYRTDNPKHDHYRGLNCRYVLMCYNVDMCHCPFPVKSNTVIIADDVSKLLYGNA